MTFLSDGLIWLQEQRHAHMTRDVYLGYERTIAKPIKGTIASSSSSSSQEGVTQQAQYFLIVCRTQDINVKKLQRGLRIWVQTGNEKDKGQLYEMAYKGKVLYEFNDPDHNDINLYCVLKADGCANPLNC